MDGKAKRGDWPGGYWRLDGHGRRIHYIRRMIGGKEGKRYDVSTRATTLRGAMEQLARFEADPGAYDPVGTIRPEGIYLNGKLAEDFLVWSRDVKRNTPKYVADQQRYLAWWGDKLKGVDLRRASLVDAILPALDSIPHRAAGYRKAVLKVLYAWLRTERHEISAAEDPTYGTLRVEQSRPAQLDRSKVIPNAHYLLAREHLTPALLKARDIAGDAAVYIAALDVLAATGVHPVSVERFASTGRVEKYRGDVEGIAGVLVFPMEKDGEPHRAAIPASALDAAKLLLEHGGFDRSKLAKALRAAYVAAEIPPFAPGQFRHSVATWAIERGADVATVAAFLGHRSPRTTRRFYGTHAVATPVPTLADALPHSVH